MKERIKQLRKMNGMNQTEFGEAIGAAQTTIAGYETGARVPLDPVVKAICKTFNVREDWLRNGNGPIEEELSQDQIITDFAADILSDQPDSFRKRLISVLSTLNADDWAVLEKIADELTNRKTDP